LIFRFILKQFFKKDPQEYNLKEIRETGGLIAVEKDRPQENSGLRLHPSQLPSIPYPPAPPPNRVFQPVAKRVGHDCTLFPVHQYSLTTSAFSRHIPEAGYPQVSMFPVFPNPNGIHLVHHDNLRAGLQSMPKYPALQIKEEPMNLSWEK